MRTPKNCKPSARSSTISFTASPTPRHQGYDVAMSLKQLTAAGTKVWSDSVEPQVIKTAVPRGITGATSNPIIIADIIKGGGFDEKIQELIDKGLSDSD